MNKMTKSETAASIPAGAEVTKRVEALLGRMSLEEKVGQLVQIGGADFMPGPNVEETIRKVVPGADVDVHPEPAGETHPGPYSKS